MQLLPYKTWYYLLFTFIYFSWLFVSKFAVFFRSSGAALQSLIQGGWGKGGLSKGVSKLKRLVFHEVSFSGDLPKLAEGSAKRVGLYQ